ncbi:hypothetical protein [Marinisporobacter balticus]|uniref:Uncharacterized protein n=1 Tax=Marinisporobacter balticus TaxID=2018667 RepID=A0A4R2KX57_9FIRM|nr:hypothetical protein [Marinisporobacter balticus]TCO79161.1 hypothetical protein EV214_103214 [Marinisporobacter balticus]
MYNFYQKPVRKLFCSSEEMLEDMIILMYDNLASDDHDFVYTYEY